MFFVDVGMYVNNSGNWYLKELTKSDMRKGFVASVTPAFLKRGVHEFVDSCSKSPKRTSVKNVLTRTDFVQVRIEHMIQQPREKCRKIESESMPKSKYALIFLNENR